MVEVWASISKPESAWREVLTLIYPMASAG